MFDLYQVLLQWIYSFIESILALLGFDWTRLG